MTCEFVRRANPQPGYLQNGGPGASPVSSEVVTARAASSSSQGDRPWKVVRIDSERSEIHDVTGESIRVSGDHETMHYIVDIVNEGGR